MSSSIFFSIKFLCGSLQKVAYLQMLRADMLALAALNAVGGLAVIERNYIAVVEVLVPAVMYLLLIIAGENIGNQYLLRAALNAVAAGGAGYERL